VPEHGSGRLCPPSACPSGAAQRSQRRRRRRGRGRAFADSALDHLSGWWLRWRLPLDCRSAHSTTVIGETSQIVFDEGLADDPELWAGPGLRRVEVWVTSGEHANSLVLGAARDETAFWAAVAEDHDLDAARLDRPARLLPTYFLTDLDGSGDLRDS
jgi:hypothetical protein